MGIDAVLEGLRGSVGSLKVVCPPVKEVLCRLSLVVTDSSSLRRGN
jgi:hypothetical protein